jgi:hypothetical protein
MEMTLMDLAKARPMGDIVVKVKGRELILLPDGVNQYFTWELHEGLTRQTVLLVVSWYYLCHQKSHQSAMCIQVGLAIIIAISFVNPNLNKSHKKHSAYHQVVSGQMEWALASVVPFWIALFLVAKMRPTRVGRLAALQILAPVQGFHFMLSYYRPRTHRGNPSSSSSSGSADWFKTDRAVSTLVHSVAAVLTANRCNVWVDSYR